MLKFIAYLLIISCIIIPFIYAGFVFAPWLPTKKKDLKRLMKEMDLQPGQRFYELGAGTGTVIVEVAKSGAHVIGFEIIPLLYFIAWIRLRKYKSTAQMRLKSFLSADLSDADAIYLFGTPEGLKDRLETKLWSECKKGTRIYSYVFQFTVHQPIEISKPSKKDLSLYIYEV